MNRLEKKCIIASTAFHGTLIGILLFGSALMPSPDDKAFKPITVYDASKVSEALTSGGSPDAVVKPAPPVAPPQQETPTLPTPKPVVQKPEPKPEPVEPPKPVVREIPKQRVEKVEIPKIAKVTKPEKIKLEPKPEAPPKEPHQIVLNKSNFTKAVRKTDDREKVEREAAENAAAAARRNAAREVASTVRNISSHLSPATLVQMDPGSGAPGALSVNYRDLIASKYYNAWSAPSDISDATPTVSATVTIDRNGNVKSARILKSSGDRAMDRSIQNVLDAVTFFEPFPASIKENEMTVTVKFNLLMKRGTG